MCELERRFWTEGTAFYRTHLARDCVMVFPPPVGQLVGDEILASIATAERWDEVDIDPTALYPLSDNVTVFSYRARAYRPSSGSYTCHTTSVYRLEDSAWLLALHQQTAVALRSHRPRPGRPPTSTPRRTWATMREAAVE